MDPQPRDRCACRHRSHLAGRRDGGGTRLHGSGARRLASPAQDSAPRHCAVRPVAGPVVRRMTVAVGRVFRRGGPWRPIAGVTAGAGLQRGLGALLVVVLIAVANRASGLHVAGIVGVSAAVSLVVAAIADLGTTPATLRDFAVTPPD